MSDGRSVHDPAPDVGIDTVPIEFEPFIGEGTRQFIVTDRLTLGLDVADKTELLSAMSRWRRSVSE